MALLSNPQSNPQLLQQRLAVREQEINALKVQNRHLLSKLDELEKASVPNQINTKVIADEVKGHIDPVIAQLQSTITNSFEILQSTMRGIYLQSTRAQQAVEDMTSHSKELELRMNDQRKEDQAFFQDKIFAMINSFCDRIERQIDSRLKALSVVEMLNVKQNEILRDLETLNAGVALANKNSDSNRGEIFRMERSAAEANERIIDIQVQSRNSEELIRDALQQIQNHRTEFRLIRTEMKAAFEQVNRVTASSGTEIQTALNEIDQFKIINDIIENKQKELSALANGLEAQNAMSATEGAMSILARIQSQKNELERVADDAKNFLKNNQNVSAGEEPSGNTNLNFYSET